jgi:hypothetical protein
MKLTKKAIVLLAAAALFTVSPAFAANQNGKGHSESGRGVSGDTGNQGNGKGVGNAGGNKGGNGNGHGDNGSGGNGGSDNGGGSNDNGNDNSGGATDNDSNDSNGVGDGPANSGARGSGNSYFDGASYENGQVIQLKSTCDYYPTLWFCPEK